MQGYKFLLLLMLYESMRDGSMDYVIKYFLNNERNPFQLEVGR